MNHRSKISVLLFFLIVFSSLSFSSPINISGGDNHSGFQADLIGNIDAISGKIFQLLEAMPQDKMDWRPAADVRSVSEVYLHIAFSNYLIMKFAGVEVPAEIAFEKMKDWDLQTLDKKEIAEILHTSFDKLKEFIKNTSDSDLEIEMEVFGMKMSRRAFFMGMHGHMHEHLGQSIAYARMNGVTPPWSKE